MEFKTEIFFIIPFITSASIIFLIIITRFIIGFCFEDKCPRCESNKNLERKRSTLINKFIPFVDSRKFFCSKCKKSFYKRSLSSIVYKSKSTNKTKKENSLEIAN